MSAAFFIVLDNPDPGFDTFVNGKAVAHCDEIEGITQSLTLKSIYDYVDGDMDGFLEEGYDDEGEELAFDSSKYAWFGAAEGIAYFSKIKNHIQSNCATFQNAEAIVADLDEYIDLLHKAASIGAKWHLELGY